MHTPDPTSPPEPVPPAARTAGEGAPAAASAAAAVARRDRIGVRVAWAVILLAVGTVVVFTFRAESARGRARQGTEAGGPAAGAAGASNPQLPMVGKYVVGINRIMPGGTQQAAAAQLREAAKTPADRLLTVPPIAELLGRDAALRELDDLSPATLPAIQPTTRSVATPAVAAATPLSRDVATLRAIYQSPPTGQEPAASQPSPDTSPAALPPPPGPPTDEVSEADRQRLRDRLGWSGRLATTFGKPDADPAREAVLNEAVRLAKLMLSIVTAAFGGLIVGLALLITAIVLLSHRQMRLRYSDPTAVGGSANNIKAAGGPAFPVASGGQPVPSPGPPHDLPPGALPPAWAGYQLPQAGAAGPHSAAYPPPPGWSPPVPPEPSPFSPSPYTAPPHQPAGHGGYSPPPAAYPSGPAAPARSPARFDLGPLGPMNGRTAPFLEAFAIYVAGQVLVGLAARLLLREYHVALNFAVIVPVLLAVAWPWARGVRGADYRRGFGFVAPRGVLRELGSGVVGYVAGLPVAAVGMLVTIILVQVSGAVPSHPIVREAAGGGVWQKVVLFGLAAVWAPIVEETFFRGALYHHLRGRWGFALSALFSSLIFAAIHPQGWSYVPGLAGLAVVFCGLREWRSGTLAGMAAHALHNGILVTLLVVGMG